MLAGERASSGIRSAAWHSSFYDDPATRGATTLVRELPRRSKRKGTAAQAACYLGREQDGTDSLAKAIAPLGEEAMGRAKREIRKATRRAPAGDSPPHRGCTGARISIINGAHPATRSGLQAERRKREQQAEEVTHWQTFEQFARSDRKGENAKAAKRGRLPVPG